MKRFFTLLVGLMLVASAAVAQSNLEIGVISSGGTVDATAGNTTLQDLKGQSAIGELTKDTTVVEVGGIYGMLEVKVSGPLQIVTTTLPDGTVGTPYSAQLVATGGVPPYRWNIESGGLPPGLSLDGPTGVISGTPTLIGGYSFNVRVTDSAGNYVIRSFELLILPPAGSGPNLEMKVLLEGFRGRASTIMVEARNDTGEIKGRCLVPLGSDGTGTNNGTWIGTYPADYPPSGANYYLVVRHRIGDFEGNHLPVITRTSMTLTDGTTTSVNLADSTSPNFKEVYTPPGKVSALKTFNTGELAMRAGYLNNDKIIDIGDYSVWKGAVTPQGTVDPANENSVRSDMNGDNIIDIGDYSLWKGTVQDFTPNDVPQTGDHVYVP